MAEVISFNTLVSAVLGGILPTLLWLWFWLREDRLHPEPRMRVMICFIAGMASVFFVLPVQKYTMSVFGASIATIILWAAVEEFAKYASASTTALHSKDFDEPIDALIYMITAALGFAALENTFFILEPLANGSILNSIATGNTRFVGASLLHVVSSAILGFFIAKTFYSKWPKKILARIAGFILAVVLHTSFNLFILKISGDKIFLVFGFVWLVVFVVLFLFERVKKIRW